MFGKVCFFILLLLSSAEAKNSAANSCSPVDLRAKLGPVRNQGPLGNCYAYMAADLLSSRDESPPISALHVAANYAAITPESAKRSAKNVDIVATPAPFGAKGLAEASILSKRGMPFQSRLEGSLTLSSAVAESLGKPLCTEAELPSEPGTNKKLFLQSLKAGQEISEDEDPFQFVFAKIRASEKRLLPEICDDVDPKKNEPFRFATKMNSAIYDWAAPVIAEDLAKSCSKKYAVSGHRVREVDTYPEKIKHYFPLLDHQLSKGNPVGIGYRVCDFTKQNNPGAPCGHASSVVGRRFNAETGSCEYLIRNSYGKACDLYRQGIECDGGNFWVPKKELLKSLSAFTWID